MLYRTASSGRRWAAGQREYPAAYIEQANRAQFLLNHGHVAGAREVFQKL